MFARAWKWLKEDWPTLILGGITLGWWVGYLYVVHLVIRSEREIEQLRWTGTWIVMTICWAAEWIDGRIREMNREIERLKQR